MPEIKRQKERLVVMFVFGAIALNFPFLSLFSRARLFFGIPVLYIALFIIWVLFIFCLAIVLEKPPFPTLTASSDEIERTE